MCDIRLNSDQQTAHSLSL